MPSLEFAAMEAALKQARGGSADAAVGEGEAAAAKKEAMAPTVWFALKKSLHCKLTQPSDVVVPKSVANLGGHGGDKHQQQQQLTAILTKRARVRSGCSRSIANLKDVIHGSKRHGQHPDRPPSCSPRSIGSSEFIQPIAHEVVLTGGGHHSSKYELKITGFGPGGVAAGHADVGGECGDGVVSSSFVGTLRPGTPGPAWQQQQNHHQLHGLPHSHSCRAPSGAGMVIGSSPMRSPSLCVDKDGAGIHALIGGGSSLYASRASCDDAPKSHRSGASGRPDTVSCHRCGEQFGKWEALEAHHLSKHAVTELAEGDSSRKIVEIICRTTSLPKTETNCGRIEKVFKVHNTQKTLARFEEYREAVKAKASKLPKKHPRCIADGNELLRFHGTAIACSFGATSGGAASLCHSDKCGICRIIRHGFSSGTRKESSSTYSSGKIGVFTTSTSGRALETVEISNELDQQPAARKALLLCRVIAGRVHKPVENIKDFVGAQSSGFDSLAGKIGAYANIEELYLLNPRALLPCFVVICKP